MSRARYILITEGSKEFGIQFVACSDGVRCEFFDRPLALDGSPRTTAKLTDARPVHFKGCDVISLLRVAEACATELEPMLRGFITDDALTAETLDAAVFQPCIEVLAAGCASDAVQYSVPRQASSSRFWFSLFPCDSVEWRSTDELTEVASPVAAAAA